MADRAPNPPGMIGVIHAGDSAHYSDFMINLERLVVPAGSEKEFERGIDRCEVMNKLVQRMLDRGFYWIWIVDEDRSFEPEIIETLLSRNEALISPITLSVDPPFRAEAMVEGANRSIVPFVLDDFTGPGTMVEVAAVGATGMLIRRAVLEAMEPPWFRRGPDGSDYLWFCTRARELNFQPYLDTSARLGNFQISRMFPDHRAGKWEISLSVTDELTMSVPLR